MDKLTVPGNIDIKYVVVRPEIDKDREPAPLEVCEVRFEVMSALNKFYYENEENRT